MDGCDHLIPDGVGVLAERYPPLSACQLTAGHAGDHQVEHRGRVLRWKTGECWFPEDCTCPDSAGFDCVSFTETAV
jgi:hypothetical protein